MVNRSPRLVLLAMVVLMVVSMMLLTNMQIAGNSEQYIDKASPEGLMYDQYNEVFVSDTFVLLIQTDNPLNSEFLIDLLILEEQLKHLDHVSDVTSIADLLKTANGGVLPQNQVSIEKFLSMLPKESLAKLLPDSQNAIAYITLEHGVSTDTTSAIVPLVEDIIEEADMPPGVSIEITGSTPYGMQLQEVMVSNASILIVAAFVIMGIVLFLLFSNMRYWFIPLILLFFGLIYTFAFMSILGIKMGNGAIAAFPILLGLGIDYAVQFQARFDEERRDGHDIEVSNLNTLKNTGPAVLLAMLATCMGFLAMFISPVPMIICFAQVAIIGVVCCYVTSLFGFPALVSVMNYAPKENTGSLMVGLLNKYNNFLERIVVKVGKFAFPILVIFLVAAVSGIYTDPEIPIDTDLSSMAPTGLPAQTTLDKVQEATGSLTAYPLYIRGDSLTNLEVVKWMDTFGTHEVEMHSELTGVSSLATLVKDNNGGKLPLDQITLDSIIAGISSETLKSYLSGENEAVISFSTIILSLSDQDLIKDQVLDDCAWSEMPAGLSASPTGDFDLYTRLMNNIAATKDLMTYLGFVLIFIFLAIAYRKIEAISPIVPIVCVVGLNAVVMVLIGMHYNVISACLGSMTIGVASEYSILVMERYIEEHKRCSSVSKAIAKSVQKVGSAVTVSGLVTAGGFSALMLSSFPIIADFGLSTLICVIFALIGAVVIMPATLTMIGRMSKSGSDNLADQL